MNEKYVLFNMSGIIAVKNNRGEVVYYCQRGIKELRADEKIYAIERGIIDPRAFSLRELPKNLKLNYHACGASSKNENFNKNILYR